MPWLVTGTWLSLLFIFEYTCFYYLASTHYIHNYPSGIDQANYLYASYALYENIVHKGLWPGLLSYQPIAPSALFIIQGALTFLVFGASRLTALSINFFYFATVQTICIFTLKSLARYPHPAACLRDAINAPNYCFSEALFVGLLLSTTTLFNQFGSLYDYRIDFIASCMYGITICLILKSQIFIIRRWVIAAAMATVWLILMRFLTAAYIAAMIFVLFIYFIIDRQRYSQLINLFLYSTIVGVLVTPVLWMHRHLLYAYYVVGHATGTEKIMRAKMVGISSLWGNLLYYPTTFVNFHLGFISFLELCLVLIVIGLCIAVNRQQGVKKSFLIFLSLSILVPLSILTVDLSKSSISINIVLIPFLLLVTLCSSYMHKFSKSLAILILSVGVSQFYWQATQPFKQFLYHKSVAEINSLLLDMGDYAERKQINTLYATADVYTDFLAAVPSYYYEQRHKFLRFECGFGCGTQTWVKDEQFALDKVKHSNLFISSKKFEAHDSFNFDRSILGFHGELKREAFQRLVLLKDYRIDEKDYQIFMAKR